MTHRTSLALRLLSTASLALAFAACSGKDAGHSDKPAAAPASGTTSAAASAAAKPAGGPLDELLDKAVACVEKGRVNRGCDGFAQLSQAVNTQRRDAAVVQNLLAAMESPDAGRKALALTLLARPFPEEGDAAARLLKRLDAETDASTKADILEALATRTAPGVDEAALKLLQSSEEPGIRAAAARLLGSKPHEAIGEQSKPALLKSLREDQAPAVRRNAATALGNLQYADALPDLIKALDDQLVAPSATFALARFETPEAYDAIWSRIEASTKDDTKVSLPLLASIRLLEKHPKHDPKKALKTLEKLQKALQKRAATNDGTAQAALKLIERNIDRLNGKAPEPMGVPGQVAAPGSGAAAKAPASAAKTPPANK